jgi:uncharacterized membrane protein/mono/diheme cytochrome c family protein
MNLPSGIVEEGSRPSMTAQNSGGTLNRFRLALVMVAPIVVVTTLATFLPPDGNERADWVQFIGRFHPLFVHFPIALFLLVPILEIVGRSARLAYLRLSVNFVLVLATLGATWAAILGWCLGRSGGYSGILITQHMWGGVLLSLICWLCWLLRTQLREFGIAYALALALGVGLVAWTGYRGGQLSLGRNHLTEHMPNALRSLLGLEDSSAALASRVDPNTFYGARIHPIFAAHCISCHGADKHRANLRLDTYRALIKGGEDGPVIRTGNAKNSDLFRRITLPAGHDDFMPKGKPPLTADELKTIELWIGAGASETLALNAIKGAPTGVATTAAAEVKFEEIDSAAVAKLRSAIGSAVTRLQSQFPNILEFDSRASADLRLNASILGSKFGDRDLEAFVPVADHIIVADLSRTAVTDHSAAAIAAMKRLHVLRLMDTRLTDATLLRLETLNQLESLNVYGTPVTAAVLPTIAKLPKLSHFYAGQTGIRAGRSVPENLVGKLVF